MSPLGLDLSRLTNDVGIDTHASSSPDGTMVVFASFRGINYDVHTMNLLGEGLTKITNFVATDDFPSWK